MNNKAPPEKWTAEKNARRCHLIDRAETGTLSPTALAELAELQAEMLKYRQWIAPLPTQEALLVFLEMAGQGCIDSQLENWQQLTPACRMAVELIERQRAALALMAAEATMFRDQSNGSERAAWSHIAGIAMRGLE